MSRNKGEESGLGNSGPQVPRLLDTAHTRSAPPLPQARPGPTGTYWDVDKSHQEHCGHGLRRRDSGQQDLTGSSRALPQAEGCVRRSMVTESCFFVPHATAASAGQSLLRSSKGPGPVPVTSTQGVRAAGGLVNAVLGAASLLSAPFQLLEA